MGTFMLGRVGLELSTGEVDGWSESGSRVNVTGYTTYGSVEQALVVRAQFMGYVDSPDEDCVPVVWSERPETDGFYRVMSVRFSSTPDGAPFGVLYWDVELERVQGYAAPLLELMTLGTVRVNTHGLVSATQAICVPDASKSVAFFEPETGVFIPFSPDVIREGSTGSVKVFELVSSFRYLTQFYLDPSAHYAGAATLYAGEFGLTAVGRQIQNDPAHWVLSNGLLELMPVESDDFDLQFRMWMDGAWSPWTPFTMVAGPSTRVPMPAPHSVTVLRNSPEEVVVRLLTTEGAGEYSPVTVDFSLKRGSRYVSVSLRSVFPSRFAVRCAAFASATYQDSTYYWKTLATGRRMAVVGPKDISQSTNDVHPNEASVVLVEEWAFAIGLTPNEVDDNVNDVVNEYMFAHSATQSVVAQ